MNSTPNPVVVTAYFWPGDGARDQVLAALEPAIEAVHSEPGCLLYAIHDAPDGSIVMIEKWATVAELDTHGSSDAVATLNKALTGLLAKPVAVTRLEPRPVGSPTQGAL